MATGTANPFYIEPAKADISPILKGLSAISQEKRAETKAAQAQTDISAALASGDPMQLANVVIKHPTYSQAAQQAFGFTNEATKRISTDAYRRALSDPENASQYIQEGIQQVSEAGGSPQMMTKDLEMLQTNPAAAQQAIKMGYASVDPAGYKSLYGDPADKFKAQEMRIKEDTLAIRQMENESRKDEQSLSRETNELKRDEIKQKIAERQQKIDSSKRDFEIDAKTKIQQAGTMTKAIDEFIGNKKYMAAMTGWRGRTPSVTTTGLEAEGYFNQIKDNLTLENLNKMTGVLTDKDIQILAGAASALRAGMSAPVMRKEMNKIKEVLKNKSADVQGMILGTVETPQAGQAPEQPPAAQAALPATNPQGWALMTDAAGNRAYVSPTGEIEEVK